MANAFDPHGFEKQYKDERKKVGVLPHGNSKLLLDFDERYRYKKKRPEVMRRTVLLRKLRECATMLGAPMKPFGVKQIKKIVLAIQKREMKRGRPYELSYWKEYVKDIKIWCKWANPKGYFNAFKECERELTVQNPYNDPKRKVTADDLMTDETFLRLLNAAGVQGKAILALLFGTGVRASELLVLNRNSIKFQPDGSLILNLSSGKTGTRQLPLRKDLAYYVGEWYNDAPRK